MLRFTLLCFAGLLISSTSATVNADQPAAEIMKKLMGVWKVDEGVNQGNEIPEEELEGTTMKIDKNTIVTYDPDKKEKYRSTYTIDVSTNPISIDMTTSMKGMSATKAFGILKFEEDDEFELCYALPGHPRPKKFESPKGSKIMLFENERED